MYKSEMSKLKDWLFTGNNTGTTNTMNNIKEDSVMKTNNITTIETINETLTTTRYRNTTPVPENIVDAYEEAAKKEIKELRKAGINRNWVMKMLPLDILEVDMAYQRDHKVKEVNDIVDNFNPNKVDIKKASIRDGHIYLVDGYHTFAALKEVTLRGKWHEGMMCQVFVGLTQKEEALLFSTQDENKRRIRGYERYHSDLCAELPVALAIKKVIEEFGATINGNTNCTRNIKGVEGLYAVYNKHGEDGLRYVFNCIKEAGWLDKGKDVHQQKIYKGLSETYDVCKDDKKIYKRLISLLRDTIKTPVNLVHLANTDKPDGHKNCVIGAFLLYYLGITSTK